MRGSIRRWLVVGTLASASLLFPACADTNQETDTATQEQMGTGGAGSAGMEGQEGKGGSGTGGTMARDAVTPGPTDAGTGGAGMDMDDASGDLPTK
nr:hypothetical protein [Archangium sp.]